MPEPKRCVWARNPLAIAYHDAEWGVPVRDERTLFEFLILEGAQAGLSWDTILAKRAHYRKVFDRFDPRKVARYDARKRARLLADAGIVRHRGKIEAAVGNAKRFLEMQREFGSFSGYLWTHVNGKPLQPGRRRPADVPATTDLSDAIARDLKKRGFKFVGSTIVYAFLQATGVVNDHTTDCFRHRELARP